MPKPLISIIVTSYNGAKDLSKCLESLLNQTFQDIEIIFVDDCSTDETPEIIEQFTQQDDRIISLRTPENLGVSGTRNFGLEKAQAEYIMFCDGDDYYAPTTCEKMFNAIESSSADLAISEIKVIYHAHPEMQLSDSNYYRLKFSGLQTINDGTILNTDYSPVNKIFRKSLLDEYQLRFPVGLHYEDAYFCMAYFMLAKTAFYLPEQLYYYIRHKSSIMSNTWSKSAPDTAIDHLYIMLRLYDFLKEQSLFDQHTALFWQLYSIYENLALTHSKSAGARKKVKQESQKFISEHSDDYQLASDEVKRQIKKLNSRLPRINLHRSKLALLKFFPTYRLAAENATQLEALSLKTTKTLQKLIEEDS